MKPISAVLRGCAAMCGRAFVGLLKKRTDVAEGYLAALAIGCGVWAGVDRPLFTPATALSRIPQWIIAGVFVGHGIVHLYAVLRGSVGLARRAALASAALWLFVSSLLLLTPPATHWAIPVTLGPFVLSAWIYVRFRFVWPETSISP